MDERGARLAELEAVIDQGLTAFRAVGEALAEILSSGLYRQEGWTSFDAYLKGRYAMSKSHGYRLIAAAQVAKIVSTIGEPRNEAQVRPLTGLLADSTEPIKEIWQGLCDQYGGPDGFGMGEVNRALILRYPPSKQPEEEEVQAGDLLTPEERERFAQQLDADPPEDLEPGFLREAERLLAMSLPFAMVTDALETGTLDPPTPRDAAALLVRVQALSNQMKRDAEMCVEALEQLMHPVPVGNLAEAYERWVAEQERAAAQTSAQVP
jgi:hypothetical protein